MDFTADSPLATIVEPGRGLKRGKLLPRAGIVATVTHTTGAGPYKRFKTPPKRWPKWATESPFTVARFLYSQRMDASGHYVIENGPNPRVSQHVPEGMAAWHVGGNKAGPYFRWDEGQWAGTGSRYAWWFKRWPKHYSPLDLAGGKLWAPYQQPPGLVRKVRAPLSWQRGSCNAWTIGFEVPPQSEGNPRGPWHPDTVDKVAEIITDVHTRHGVAIRRETVLTHSDAHPLARTTRGEPWDANDKQWFPVLEALRLSRCG